jgi:adenosylcobinamide-phosphate synthase
MVLGILALEAVVGYPRRLPHPVTWVGRVIAGFEFRWNKPQYPRKFLGIIALVIIASIVGLLGWVLQTLLPPLLIILIATVGLAQRSLYDHVVAVMKPLVSGDLAAARLAVSKIVGRDTENLDASGVAAATLESLAESFNDGIVAPTFWLLVGGLPGLFIYKAVNTADSLIGHKEERWRDFGWAAARADDLLNLIPARIAGALIVVAGWGGWRTMWADARKHASPNAGWPEAAFAGALRLRLGGPASYEGQAHDRPVFGDGPAATAEDLQRGLTLYIKSCLLVWALLAAGGFLWRP